MYLYRFFRDAQFLSNFMIFQPLFSAHSEDFLALRRKLIDGIGDFLLQFKIGLMAHIVLLNQPDFLLLFGHVIRHYFLVFDIIQSRVVSRAEQIGFEIDVRPDEFTLFP